MAREWIALERQEGRAHDLSLYARALHAQLHRWVDGEGKVPARLEGDLCDAMARAIAYRYGATKGDRRLIAGHLAELVTAGAVVLSLEGLELRALADGADLVKHKLAVGNRPSRSREPSANRPRTATNEQRTATNEQRTETRSDLTPQDHETHVSRVEEKRVEENLPSEGTRAPEALALSPALGTKAKGKRAKAPPADREPEPGTLAAKVRDVIVGDPVLAPLVVAPGDLAIRLCAEGAYPGVDVLASVRAAGAWAAGKLDGGWRDGRAGLLNWLRREAAEVARTPRPAAASPRQVTPSRPAEPQVPPVERKLLTLDQIQRARRVTLEARLAAGGES